MVVDGAVAGVAVVDWVVVEEQEEEKDWGRKRYRYFRPKNVVKPSTNGS